MIAFLLALWVAICSVAPLEATGPKYEDPCYSGPCPMEPPTGEEQP